MKLQKCFCLSKSAVIACSPLSATIATLLLVTSVSAQAEEGGSGHYQPGSISSFADGVSPVPTFIARLNVVNYRGNYGTNLPLPISGSSVLNVDANATALGLTLAWVPDWGVLNDTWTYQMSATIPYLFMDASGDVQAPTPRGQAVIKRSDSVSDLGDVVLMPLMFNQKVTPDFNINYRVAVYAPTGSYEVGRLANTGKNYWTVEPTVGFMYLGKENGREASLFFGADFNEENPDTQYKTGTQLHIDSTFAQHFPLAGGLAGVGVTGYWYQQVEADSGSGANFGSFKGATNGVGPVISYVVNQAKGSKLVTEFRWMHEFEVERRLSGGTLFMKAMLFF